MKRQVIALTALLLAMVFALTPTIPTYAANGHSETGPWLVYTTSSEGGYVPDQIWVANPDGSGSKLISNGEYVFHVTPSPTENLIAFMTADSQMLNGIYTGMTLVIMNLPAGDVVHSIPLTWQGSEPLPSAEVGMADHIRAMTEMHSLEWSPDGWSIAFMGAMDGSSSDLYVYSFRTEELLRLTDGPTQGYAPHWSPDGQWIVHFGADTFGTGAGATVTGAWAARADGSEIRTLYNPNSGGEFFVGWVNDSTFMVYTWNVECGARELRTVDINTNAVSMVWESWFTDAAVGSGQTLVSAKGLEGCGVTSGLYLNGAQISATGTDRVVWSAHNGIFFAGSYEGTAYSVSVRGEVMPLETMYIPVVSADAEKWAGITLDGVLYAGFIQPGNTPAAIAPNARSVVYVG